MPRRARWATGLFDRVNIQTAFMGAAGFALEAGPLRRDRRGGADQALDGRGRRAGDRLVDHTKWQRVAFATFCRTDDARRGRHRRPGARRRWSTPSARRGIDVHLVDAGPRRAAIAGSRAGERAVVTEPARPASRRRPAPRCAACPSRSRATQALTDVSLDLRAGEVHALVGENGAGKSTLVKILAGVHQPGHRHDRVDGEPTVIAGPAQARALGIAVVHQEPRLFPDLSVAENVFIGHAPAGPLRTVDWGEMRRQAQALFDGSSTSGSTSRRPSAGCRWPTSS